MEGPSSLSSWPPRHGTTAPRLPPPDRAARGARSPRTCQCRRTRPLPLLSHAAATAPPSRNERGPPMDLQLGFCSWSRLLRTRASRPSRAQTSAPAFVSPSLRARACFGTVFSLPPSHPATLNRIHTCIPPNHRPRSLSVGLSLGVGPLSRPLCSLEEGTRSARFSFLLSPPPMLPFYTLL